MKLTFSEFRQVSASTLFAYFSPPKLDAKLKRQKRVTFTVEQKKFFERKEQGTPKRKFLPECSQKQQEKKATGNYRFLC